MDDLVPAEILKRILKKWWLLVIITIAGGILGLAFSQLHQPVYESQASITTTIDFAYAGRLNESEEDYLISTIGDVIGSSEVMEWVKQSASSRDIQLTDEQIRNQFSKARQGYRWDVTVRDHDPQIAQALAQMWVEAADRGLSDLRQNTLKSLMAQSAQQSLQDCFSQMVAVEPASSYCSFDNIAEIQKALADSTSQVIPYSLSDALMLSKISTQITENAYLPTSPVILKRDLATLAGAFCGLLIGLGVFVFGKSKTG